MSRAERETSFEGFQLFSHIHIFFIRLVNTYGFDFLATHSLMFGARFRCPPCVSESPLQMESHIFREAPKSSLETFQATILRYLYRFSVNEVAPPTRSWGVHLKSRLALF